MNEVIIYLLKVITVHGLLYLLYRLLLLNTARHSLNRGYLLGSFLLAFVIPFIEMPVPESVQALPQENLIIWLAEPAAGLEQFELVPIREASSFSYWSLIPWVYGCIALALVIRSLFYIVLLGRLKKHSEPIKKRWFKLFKTSHHRPFSFFSNVFIPKTLFGSNAFRQILAHECVHVRQLHSLDRLLLDFVGSLFWFNPFIYLYRNALIEIHEYQADEAVIRRFNDPIGYQEIIFSQLQSAEYSGLVSHFNYSMIKKRIVMMNKQHKMTGWVYALTVPVTLMIAFAFSSKEAMEPINGVGDELATLLEPERGFDWTDLNLKELLKEAKNEPKGILQDNEPSILPLKQAENVKMTSGFGMRMHPTLKVRQMHQGMDFSCPVGTDVIATADGKVAEVRTNKEGVGYGKMVLIDHGGGYVTRYAQLSEFKVKEGDNVKKGDVIALSGNSGQSTAPHLHYEVKKDGEFVDPANYIKDYDFRPRIREIKSPQSDVRQKEEALRKKEQELAAKELALAEKEEAIARKEMLIVDQSNEAEVKRAQLEVLRAEEEREQAEMEKRIIEEKMQFLSIQNEDDASIRIGGSGSESIDRTPPLFVVNGEVVTEVSGLRPDEIESVVVLKGAKAKDKYGDKADNGVVEITTKEKNKGKTKDKLKEKDKSKQEDNLNEQDPIHQFNRLAQFYNGYPQIDFLKKVKDMWRIRELYEVIPDSKKEELEKYPVSTTSLNIFITNEGDFLINEKRVDLIEIYDAIGSLSEKERSNIFIFDEKNDYDAYVAKRGEANKSKTPPNDVYIHIFSEEDLNTLPEIISEELKGKAVYYALENKNLRPYVSQFHEVFKRLGVEVNI